MPLNASHRLLFALLLTLAWFAWARPAHAVMDITNNGPRLQAGHFEMRITNIGVLGNAFANTGLSFDPSFQYPRGGRYELLNRAELWVSATAADGATHVSGGPMLEWRPTLAPDDTVRIASAGDPGTRAHADDDGDGRIDEDPLNGRDDDGDGRVDEDFLLPAQQMLTAEYTDDQRQAVEYTYPSGERHVPLGLTVHQEAYGFTAPGHDDIAGLTYTITNHGRERLRDVRLGMYADLDVRFGAGGPGHLDDRYEPVHYEVLLNPREDTLSHYAKPCVDRIEGEAVMIRDTNPTSGAPGVMIVPLSHTTDPIGWFLNDAFPGVREARALSRAPRRDSTFRMQPFIAGAPPGLGGPPTLDVDRARALAGTFPTAHPDPGQDYAVLLSCGPFATLAPGQSVQFSFAIRAVAAPESAAVAAFDTRMLFRGARLDLQANGTRRNPQVGDTGINGHEACVEPPPGVVFLSDPDCVTKVFSDPLFRNLDPRAPPATGGRVVEYAAGHCVWTDLDCEACTGDDGIDTVRPWETDVRLPPLPHTRATAGSRRVTIEWDDLPEQAIRAGRVGGATFRFAGYKVYRLEDWHRESLLPEPNRWQRLAVYRVDASEGGRPLTEVTNEAIAPLGQEVSGPRYPIGRYRFEDTRVLDGFDYQYVVTAILREIVGPYDLLPPREYESPFYASFEDRVVPHAAATAAAGTAWVVPNPYRGSAPWERQAVSGDTFTRHVDFMGLPTAHSTIRIYTLAGDLVQTIEHDGSRGDGQAAWNLISRNGQDIESGVYLFTVSSALGHQTGRFVVLR